MATHDIDYSKLSRLHLIDALGSCSTKEFKLQDVLYTLLREAARNNNVNVSFIRQIDDRELFTYIQKVESDLSE